MKIFAFYLPQYHEIPENDAWWGKGFTEWVNVRKAKPLYKNHEQPQKPLNDNYYNLLNKETIEWQTELMKRYKVSGMIYYHYYFKGKMLLEKPAENLLKWKDIDQPFFFCWANHTWNRSWNGTKEVLLKQEYGNENDWEHHFQYLLPFFLDNRYEKKDNKPVIMLYQPIFEEKKAMFDYFEKRCIDNGFSGIFLIETCIKADEVNLKKIKNNTASQCAALFFREPNVSQNLYLDEYYKTLFSNFFPRLFNRITRKKRKPAIFDGNKLYEIMENEEVKEETIIRGAFFRWDNTPRHGERGYIIKSVNKEKFFEYLNQIKDDEYCFINAWNEWAEGMMLEPTENEKYQYLEWIKEWMEKQTI